MNHLGVQFPGRLTDVPLFANLERYPIGDNSPSQFFNTFHDGLHGWKISHGGRKREPTELDLLITYDQFAENESLTAFVQRWLFFELLRVVFDVDPKRFVEGNRQWVTTEPLEDLIKRWRDTAKAAPTASSTYGQIVRAQRALDRARHYVSNFCAAPGPDNPVSTWPVDPKVSLSLMALGETLTIALIQIQKEIAFTPSGWSNLDLSSLGWGYSGFVLEKLAQNPRWCKKTIRMLQGLMQNNTIGLLYATQADPPSKFGEPHNRCSATSCKVEEDLKNQWSTPKGEPVVQNGMTPAAHQAKSRKARPNKHPARSPPQVAAAEDTSKASNLYHDPTCRREHCVPVGPTVEELNDIVLHDKVPLLHYTRGANVVQIEQRPVDELRRKPYVVFSHVFSDGFGNPKTNRLNKCNLNYFLRLFNKLRPKTVFASQNPVSETSLPFWIDTMTIPVKRDDNAEAIRKGIHGMHDVYFYASDTIVLDLSIMRNPRSREQFLDLAMSITISNWMRRLWTLQEAYLSQEVWFVLSGDELYSLRNLENEYRSKGGQIHDPLPEKCRAYFQGILGEDRGRIQRGGVTKPEIEVDAKFVAAVWRAVQWRTTSYTQHETLALATLFHLDTDPFADTSNTTNDARYTEATCDALMQKLLEALGDLPRCAIPPGMIFLPGRHLNIRGYGWAPRSWLSARETDPPDPLGVQHADARIEKGEGLRVAFPGFRLYAMDPRPGPLQMEEGEKISFAADSNLIEWYTLEEADTNWFFKTPFAGGGGGSGSGNGEAGDADGPSLAVVVPRLPLLNPKEIALLVHVKAERADTLYVDIVHRAWLYRESDGAAIRRLQARFDAPGDGAALCGEIRPATQAWCVDRRGRPAAAPPAVSVTSADPGGGGDGDGVASSQQSVESHRFFNQRKVKTLTTSLLHGARDGVGNLVQAARTFTFKRQNPLERPRR